jgi:DNA-directed RNA polymerase sigma subunit (sigma70/sigma32)
MSLENSESDDIVLWKKWKASKSDKDLSALFRRLDPLIQSNVNKYSAAPIPRSALEGEAKKWALKAFEGFNPNMGVKLSTHVSNYLRKLYRYTVQHQNIGRIPEHRALQINSYKVGVTHLHDKLGRTPTNIEVADHLAWPIKHVNEMQSSLRQDIAASTGMGEEGVDKHSPQMEVINLGYHSLTPEEQIVFDYTLGMHGKKKLAPGEIAATMKLSNSKVSKLRNSITAKLQGFISNA